MQYADCSAVEVSVRAGHLQAPINLSKVLEFRVQIVEFQELYSWNSTHVKWIYYFVIVEQ